MKSLRKFALAGITAALAGFGTPSQAVLISAGVSNPYSFSWSKTVIGSDQLQHTLTGFGSMTVSGFNSSSLSVTVSLSNTSLIGGQGGERLTAFGFGIDPNATSLTFVDAADGGMINAVLGQTFPVVQGIDVCARGGSTCAGGGNGGIFAGTSDTFGIVLGGTWGSSVNIAPVGFKYQTGYGSFEFPLPPPTGVPPTATAPEPATLALLGLGLAGLAATRRRKQ